MSVATVEPPATASAPPSQKSFCTSMTSNAVLTVYPSSAASAPDYLRDYPLWSLIAIPCSNRSPPDRRRRLCSARPGQWVNTLESVGEHAGDRRFPGRELQPLPGQAHQSVTQSVAVVLQRGKIVGQLTVAYERNLQRAVVRSDFRWLVDGVDDFLGCGAGGFVSAQCRLAATTGRLVGAAFGDGATVDRHEFVHHFRCGRTGTAHYRAADTVSVHRRRPQ